jgi:hypothetical protein
VENFYGRVLVGDVLCMKKNRGGCTQMVIEVRGNIFEELIMIRTSKLRKIELKLGGKPTTEGHRHWIHPVKTKNDGK